MNALEKSSHLTQLTHTPHVDSMRRLMSQVFKRVTYTQALAILNESTNKAKSKSKSNMPPLAFGDDLNKEQEKQLVELLGGVPVFLTHYPKRVKPFYMRQCATNGDLVENFDLLVPGVGEIVGGSLRESRVDVLEENIKRNALDLNVFGLYLETKKFGSMKMGGRKDWSAFFL